MGDAWFTTVADELARCLVDARECAAACERALEEARDGDRDLRRRLGEALVAPAAVARALIDLIDQPPQLVLAAVHLCRETTRDAIPRLAAAPDGVDLAEVTRSLEAAAGSCERLLAAADETG